MNILTALQRLIGPKYVLIGSDAAVYGKDWMGVYVSQPLAVLRPADTTEVSEILKLANETGTAIVPIGGNTGLVGGTYAPDALMLSLDRLNKIVEIKPDSHVAIVQAGAILSNIHAAVEEKDLTFPLFFGARGSAMIGGALSTNAGGSNVLRYGNTRALCLGLEVVLADGRIMNLMSELRKDNTGYDLKDLFIGAEGTLGVITAAVLKLVPRPREYATAMVAATSLPAALTMLNRLQKATGGMVEGFEYMPRTYMACLLKNRPDLVPPLGYDQDTTILVELGATAPRDIGPNSDGSVPVVQLLEGILMEMIDADLASDAAVAKSSHERQKMWAIREAAAEITLGRMPYVDTDVAVPLDQVTNFMQTALAQLKKIDARAETNTVAHLGDGNLHFTVWPSRDDPKHHKTIRTMIDDLAIELGGSFSAEHGVGLTKKATLATGKDPVAYALMQTIKKALDPNGIMNPGKILP
ncbi:MAG: FAD-binding oxidoreductase [Paracoccaceae bacterium]